MNRDNAVLIIFGVLALIIGIALKLFIGRRKFYRRNSAGVPKALKIIEVR